MRHMFKATLFAFVLSSSAFAADKKPCTLYSGANRTEQVPSGDSRTSQGGTTKTCEDGAWLPKTMNDPAFGGPRLLLKKR
jgi:hypothetical protein